eukprot:CAMPEP_0182450892 /NCGR_PEP_ID=MMETSP1172-20130603/43421_1 /TAXON_ID=708627 /ORGANISM="Timspurckia oligopyrenoides, Strain CCMP3278" /LENGTH=459 /DNA_ID=CAMNT_0024648615 /DNA_START=518 /DNA_END=1897 /DNA_ORIENTATION=+
MKGEEVGSELEGGACRQLEIWIPDPLYIVILNALGHGESRALPLIHSFPHVLRALGLKACVNLELPVFLQPPEHQVSEAWVIERVRMLSHSLLPHLIRLLFELLALNKYSQLQSKYLDTKNSNEFHGMLRNASELGFLHSILIHFEDTESNDSSTRMFTSFYEETQNLSLLERSTISKIDAWRKAWGSTDEDAVMDQFFLRFCRMVESSMQEIYYKFTMNLELGTECNGVHIFPFLDKRDDMLNFNEKSGSNGKVPSVTDSSSLKVRKHGNVQKHVRKYSKNKIRALKRTRKESVFAAVVQGESEWKTGSLCANSTSKQVADWNQVKDIKEDHEQTLKTSGESVKNQDQNQLLQSPQTTKVSEVLRPSEIQKALDSFLHPNASNLNQSSDDLSDSEYSKVIRNCNSAAVKSGINDPGSLVLSEDLLDIRSLKEYEHMFSQARFDVFEDLDPNHSFLKPE